MKKSILKLEKKEIRIMISFGIFLIALPIFCTWGAISFISFKDTGDIGDTIGGITSPFLSFFGSVLVYLALKAQIEANEKLQRQFDEQKKIDYRQNFENTFFSLLSLHHEIVGDMDLESEFLKDNTDNMINYQSSTTVYFTDVVTDIDNKRKFKSRDVFHFSQKLLYNLLDIEKHIHQSEITYKKETDNIKKKDHKLLPRYANLKMSLFIDPESTIEMNGHKLSNRFESVYDNVYGKLSSDFGHYFRSLYRILKFIDEKNSTMIKSKILKFNIPIHQFCDLNYRMTK